MSKRPSVLVLTTSFPLNDAIAVGIHVIEKCRGLVKNGYDVTVLAPNDHTGRSREIIDGITVKRFTYFLPKRSQRLAYGAGIPTNLKRSVLAKIQLPFFMLVFLVRGLLESRKHDLIHCHWSIAGFVGVMVKKLTGKKMVYMQHGAEVFVLGDHPVVRMVLKNCDYLICNSSFTEKRSLEVYPVKRHSVVSPGVDVHRFYPQHRIDNLRKNLGIGEEEIFLMTIGKFIPRKGIRYLIEAMNVLVNERNKVRYKLRIGGRGPLKTEYEALIANFGLQDYVDFLPYIPDDDIPSYYTEADIFVLPSIVDDRGDTEGLGVVYLEANACETPVLGTDVGGIVDAIEDGVSGYFIGEKDVADIADKIELLGEDPELRKRLGLQGRKRIEEKFNWNEIARRIIEIYGSL